MAAQTTRRDVHGIVLLDKPINISSNAALQAVKRIYRARKAGHTGSLDPLASGLLPICLGEATKISGFLLEASKRYCMSCRLGVTTRTGDAEGEITEIRPVTGVTQERIDEVLKSFVGTLAQVPPMFSALKHQGQPLYKLARRGQTVERQPRQITIHQLTLLRHEGNILELETHCSKGAYMRTLAEDIGAALGCGAHLSILRRIGLGDFEEHQAVTLEQLQGLAEKGVVHLDGVLYPMESALARWPDVRLSDEAAYYLTLGQAVRMPSAPAAGRVKLFMGDQRFLGIGQVLEDGRVAPKRLIHGH